MESVSKFSRPGKSENIYCKSLNLKIAFYFICKLSVIC